MRTRWGRLFLAVATVSVLLISIASSPAEAGTYTWKFYNSGGWWSPPARLRSPNRTDLTGTTDSYPQINSKWNQPRTEGTNPHQGVDLNNGQDTPVWAVGNGTVVRKGTYEVLIRLTSGWYVQYRHIAPVATLAVNDTVTAATQLGKVTKEDPYALHLHLGVVSHSPTDFNSDIWANNDYWFPDASPWNYGADLDFITRPYINTTNQLFITAYSETNGSNGSVRYLARKVLVWHRNGSNKGQWVSSTMSVYSSPSYRWMIDFRSLQYKDSTGTLRYYKAGDIVQYIVAAYRAIDPTFTTAAYGDWAVYPAYYSHPDEDPNTWTASPTGPVASKQGAVLHGAGQVVPTEAHQSRGFGGR